MTCIQVSDDGQCTYVKQFFARERSRQFLSLFLCSWHSTCPEATGMLSQIRATTFQLKGRRTGASNVSMLLHHFMYLFLLAPSNRYMREVSMSLFSRVASKGSQRLCIASKVTQCQCEKPGFESGSGGASLDKTFPSEHSPTCQEHTNRGAPGD